MLYAISSKNSQNFSVEQIGIDLHVSAVNSPKAPYNPLGNFISGFLDRWKKSEERLKIDLYALITNFLRTRSVQKIVSPDRYCLEPILNLTPQGCLVIEIKDKAGSFSEHSSHVGINGFGAVKSFQISLPRAIKHTELISELNQLIGKTIIDTYKETEENFVVGYQKLVPKAVPKLYSFVRKYVEKNHQNKLFHQNIKLNVCKEDSDRLYFIFDEEALRENIARFKENKETIIYTAHTRLLEHFNPVELTLALLFNFFPKEKSLSVLTSYHAPFTTWTRPWAETGKMLKSESMVLYLAELVAYLKSDAYFAHDFINLRGINVALSGAYIDGKIQESLPSLRRDAEEYVNAQVQKQERDILQEISTHFDELAELNPPIEPPPEQLDKTEENQDNTLTKQFNHFFLTTPEQQREVQLEADLSKAEQKIAQLEKERDETLAILATLTEENRCRLEQIRVLELRVEEAEAGSKSQENSKVGYTPTTDSTPKIVLPEIDNEYDRLKEWLAERGWLEQIAYYNPKKKTEPKEEVVCKADYRFLTRDTEKETAETIYDDIFKDWLMEGNHIFQFYLRGKVGLTPKLMIGLKNQFKEEVNAKIPPKKSWIDQGLKGVNVQDHRTLNKITEAIRRRQLFPQKS
jgi:hypothetical protein